jgi:phosphomannomutase
MLDPKVFKAYDVRGVYPEELDEAGAYAIGRAYVEHFEPRAIAVGRDMRLSSPALAAAFIDGATSQGADVVDYGMIATDMLYFAVARDGHGEGRDTVVRGVPEVLVPAHELDAAEEDSGCDQPTADQVTTL